MDHSNSLLAEIEAFISTHEIAPTAFGAMALNDKHFVRDLRKGRRVWPETAAKVRHAMLTHRPKPKQDAH